MNINIGSLILGFLLPPIHGAASPRPGRPPAGRRATSAPVLRLLGPARTRSYAHACPLSNNTLLVASEWMRGKNLRRVALHLCRRTPTRYRCTSPVDLPLSDPRQGFSHPFLVCPRRPRTAASNATVRTQRNSKPQPTLLFVRHGRLAAQRTHIAVFAITRHPRCRPGSCRTAVLVQKLSNVSVPRHTLGTDLVPFAHRGPQNLIWLTVSATTSTGARKLWLLHTKDGQQFSLHPRKALWTGRDGAVLRLAKRRFFALYRRRKPQPSRVIRQSPARRLHTAARSVPRQASSGTGSGLRLNVFYRWSKDGTHWTAAKKLPSISAKAGLPHPWGVDPKRVAVYCETRDPRHARFGIGVISIHTKTGAGKLRQLVPMQRKRKLRPAPFARPGTGKAALLFTQELARLRYDLRVLERTAAPSDPSPPARK
jgi:hypothetical protein